MTKKVKITYHKVFDGNRDRLFGYGPSKVEANKMVRLHKILGFKSKIISFEGYPVFGTEKGKQYAIYVSNKRIG